MTTPREHEQGLVKFILPARQDRYLDLLAKPKRRIHIRNSLAHFKHLDPACVVLIGPREHNEAGILRLLKSKGAPGICYALSEADEMDGREVPLSEALGFILGRGIGTFLSCIPGRLAYFEDEDGRYVLERNANLAIASLGEFASGYTTDPSAAFSGPPCVKNPFQPFSCPLPQN